MEIAIDEMRASLIYQHLVRIIVPRPVAWVSTRGISGVSNLAPFSFFSGVGSRPPSLLFCPANRLDGKPKDTLRNIRATGEFVVNVVSEDLVAAMNQTAAELSENESEFEAYGVSEAPSALLRAPRVATSPVSIECRLLNEMAVGEGPGGANIVVGSIVHIHIRDDVLDETGFADASKLKLVGRMGGDQYACTDNTFELGRP